MKEVFLEFIADQSAKLCEVERRKTVTYKDVSMILYFPLNYNMLGNVVESDPRLSFLKEIIPKQMGIVEAIEYKRRKDAELGITEETKLDDGLIEEETEEE